MNYDIIGDIHGHADALKALLQYMGYRDSRGAWRHPDRKAIFVGDFIDRGPKQVESVEIARRMVDADAALAVMGNHEFNAIGWFLPDESNPGEYLRPHHSPKYGDKNFRQHKVFLDEVEGTPRHKEIIDWFLTLPLWLDLPELRIVHACWHQRFMDFLAPRLAPGQRLTRDLMAEASREPKDESEKDNAEPSVFKAVEALTVNAGEILYRHAGGIVYRLAPRERAPRGPFSWCGRLITGLSWAAFRTSARRRVDAGVSCSD